MARNSQAGTKRQPLGSQLILSQLKAHFTSPTPTRSFPLTLTPRHLIAKRNPTSEPNLQPSPIYRADREGGTTPSWRAWAENNVVDQWKEACGEVVNYRGFDFTTAKDLPQVLYEFPDGYSGNFGEERYRFNEILFDPKNYFNQVSRDFQIHRRNFAISFGPSLCQERQLTDRTSPLRHRYEQWRAVLTLIRSRIWCLSLSSYTIPSCPAMSTFEHRCYRTLLLWATHPSLEV